MLLQIRRPFRCPHCPTLLPSPPVGSLVKGRQLVHDRCGAHRGYRSVRCLRAVNDDDVDLKRLLAAFTFEEQRGYTNAEGRREVFSTFASRSVKSLEDIPAKLRRQHRQISIALEHYASLDHKTRMATVHSGRDLVTELESWSSVNQISPHAQATFSQRGGVLSFRDNIRWVSLDERTSEVPDKESALKQQEASKREISRASFAESASSNVQNEEMSEEELAEMEQGSDAWMAFRKSRLTASFVSNILGMFGSRKQCIRDAWLEKIGLKKPFEGNALTRWGNAKERTALDMYRAISGHHVEKHGFALMGPHAAETWIGGSPDGIIKLNDPSSTTQMPSTEAQHILTPCSSTGLLEIKCPAKNGSGDPQNAMLYDSLPFYYVPQVQCLMELLDLEWTHLYVWTAKNGSRIFFMPRDKQYFLALYHYMATFWWNHVIPAKSSLENANGEADYMQYAPNDLDPTHLIQESRQLAAKAPQLTFDSMGQCIP